MTCPKCGADFPDNRQVCPECGAAAGSSTTERPDPNLELVTVFTTGDPADVMVAKSLLDDAGIEYFAKDEGVQDVFGAGRIGSGFNVMAGQVEIQVRPEDEDSARQLLLDLDEGTTTREPGEFDPGI
jgi:hypothetical protein